MTISVIFFNQWHTVSLTTMEYIALQTTGTLQLVDAYFDESENEFMDTIWAIDGGIDGNMFVASTDGEVIWEGSMREVEMKGFELIEDMPYAQRA